MAETLQSSPDVVDVDLRIPAPINAKFTEAIDKIKTYYPDIHLAPADLITFHLFRVNTDEFPTDLALDFLEFVRNSD